MAEIALSHRRAGSGEPLVAIHGIGSTWQVWQPVLPALEERHDVLALSLPGYGESAPLREEPTVPALTDAVERALDAAGMDRAHLVGNSLGGWIAAELAARGRALTATAVSPAGLWTRKELNWSCLALRNSFRLAQRLAPHAETLTATGAGRALLFGQTCARPARLDPANAALQLRLFAGSPSFDDTLSWIDRNTAMPAGLRGIDCPVLVLWGTRDLLLPPRQAPRWRATVPGAELRMLPRLGHVPMSDDPDLVAEAMLDWAARQPRSRSPRRPAAARA